MVSYKLAYPETHISHLKMDGWETILSLWGKRPIFRGELLLPGSVHHLEIALVTLDVPYHLIYT